MQVIYDAYHYAPAVLVGNQVHVSGLLGFTADGSVPADFAAQVSNIFDHLELILAEAGTTLAAVYSITSYHLNDLKGQMPEFTRIQVERLGSPHPAWTAIGTTELALSDALVEVSAQAFLPGV